MCVCEVIFTFRKFVGAFIVHPVFIFRFIISVSFVTIIRGMELLFCQFSNFEKYHLDPSASRQTVATTNFMRMLGLIHLSAKFLLL